MNATDLYRAGKLDDAIRSLNEALRGDPTNTRLRTFLFELLCFAGDLDRAEKQLDVLSRSGKEAEMGALVYRSALHGERLRRSVFAPDGIAPSTAAPHAVKGTLNGKPFASLEDADPRVGARLEIFAAGQYTWLPLQQVATVSMAPPKRLRDLLWAPALVRTSPDFQGVELGEVLLPVLTPEAHGHEDPEVRLGRVTDWQTLDNGTEVPVGQRMLLVDGEAFPLLELRELVVAGTAD
jgi:type VI secretion system protein ImpE